VNLMNLLPDGTIGRRCLKRDTETGRHPAMGSGAVRVAGGSVTVPAAGSSDVDPDIPIYKQAKAEYAKLQ
jgi:hypothetical protein